MKRSTSHCVLGAALLAATLWLSGCGGATEASAERDAASSPTVEIPYRIVATTAMIGDIVRNVVGERADVASLMGSGVDPHLYRPTRSDVSLMLDADVVFYNGLNLEGKMSDTFVTIARQKPVHAVSALVDEDYLLEPPAFAGHFDPHLWMDPIGWVKATEAVIDALAAFDAAGADLYKKNGKAYVEQLRRIDDYARAGIQSIPEQNRVLVTAHDAFNYFARAYDIEVEGIQGISTESEAGLRRIEELVDLLVDRNVSAVFIETSVSARNINALIEGAAARGREVVIGGSLFSDAMGAPGSYEGTYIGMIDHNVTTIVRALGGEAPAAGYYGELSTVQ